MRLDELGRIIDKLAAQNPKYDTTDCSVIADIRAGYHQALNDVMRSAILAERT